MSNQRYNGWSNYETWNVALWLDNDPSEYAKELAEDILKDAIGETEQERRVDATNTLADHLEAFHEEHMPDMPPSVYSDLLSASLRGVYWYEIAEHYIDDLEIEE